MNALYEALQNIVEQNEDGIEILYDIQGFCEWFEKIKIDKNDVSVMMFFNLVKREAAYCIEQFSDEYSDSYTLALTVYASLFGKEKLSEESERIMLEHIEFIIALLQKKQIIDSDISHTNTKYISDLKVAVSTTLRRKGTRILSNVKTFRALLKDFMGNSMAEEIDSFCDFIERVEKRNIDYPNDLKFNIPTLFTALQENKESYIPLQNEYENIISEYIEMGEAFFGENTEFDSDDEYDSDDEVNEMDDVGYLKNMAIQAYKNRDINNAMFLANKVLSVVQNDWELFYLKALCLETYKNYIGALFEIDNALKYAPNVAYLHHLKARCLRFTGDYLNAVNSGTKAIDLYAQSKKYAECKNFSLWLLNAVDMHFKYFTPTSFDDDVDYYTNHITCFDQLANLEYAPESIKNTYRKYKQATIDAFKKAILYKDKDRDMFGGYSDEKILEECNQFLSHPHIDNDDKKEIYKTVQWRAKYSDRAKQMLETFHFLAEDSSDSEQKPSIDSYSSPQFSPILYDDEFDDFDDEDDEFGF